MENIKLFEPKNTFLLDNEQEKWFFHCRYTALTDSNNPQVYWRVLKKRLWLKEMKPLQIVTV
jgi:hypothetical protein